MGHVLDLLAGPAALAVVSAAFYALALVLTQLGLRHLPPWRGAAVSVPTTAGLFWLLAPFALDFAAWRWDAAAIFAAVGLLFPAAVTVLTFEANRRLGPNVAGAVGNLAPLFAVGGAVVALGEVPGPVRLVGIAMIVAGVTLLALRGARPRGGTPTTAFALPLAAAGIRGAVQPAVKSGLALWSSPFAAGLIGYTVSAVVVLAAASLATRGAAARDGLLGDGAAPAPRWPHGRSWFAAVGLCNGAAVLLMYAALARGPVALVSPLVATYPLFTLIFARLFLPVERTGAAVAAGVAATVAGVALLLAG